MPSSAALASVLTGFNAEYIANLYSAFLKNPADVDGSWRSFFADLRDDEAALLREISGASWAAKDFKKPNAPFGVTTADEALKSAKPANKAGAPASVVSADALKDTFRALMLVRAYRQHGHFAANLDPLGLKPPAGHVELDPSFYGLIAADMGRSVYVGGLLGLENTTFAALLEKLRAVYAGTVGVEFEQIGDPTEKEWLQSRFETGAFKVAFSRDEKKRIYGELVSAQGLEDFLHTKYVGTKRFGLDGGEAYIPTIEEIMRTGVKLGIREVSIGMAHRGRLNTLTNVCGKPYTKLLAEFNGVPSNPDGTPGSGDVKYHMGYSNDRMIEGQDVHITLTPNPSHLEVVNPVVTGKVRAIQNLRGDTARKAVLTLLIHGDAAFAGQGLVMETLMLSGLKGYTVGGTVHIIINNQVGFTTNPDCSRSGPYSSDLIKMLGCPIFHVNGDDIEAVVSVARLATEFRQQFGKDVMIDLICYRRNGHNEGDEPMFTQPIMYKAIKDHPTTRTLYGKQLVAEGVLSEAEAKDVVDGFMKRMDDSFEATKSYKPNKADWLEGRWAGLKPAHGVERRGATAISKEIFMNLADKLTAVPEGFNVNSKIARQLEAKKEMFRTHDCFDWGTAEAMAFGALLMEGHPVRLSGQDCERGTFSHRHSVLNDQVTEEKYIPLGNLSKDQAQFEVLNSPLSESAVLGYEFGYTWADPNALVLWEGQFGDFVNGAQVIIDQYIASAESKWLRMSGLVMILPHGMEGQGPEHSSARLERFLQLSAEDNWQVTNITTPANYFHALRRQLKRDFRKPLINMSPKSLLRHKLAISKADDFMDQSTFHRILWDGAAEKLAKPKDMKRIVLCSGKVYYDLFEEREKRGINNVMILRLEQLYPFPAKALAEELAQYGHAEIVWCQEEPKNQGAWSFVNPEIEEVLALAKFKNTRARYVGRMAAAAPATGYMKRHAEEQAKLVDEALTV
ncbi:MAG: 2-oxoglutarate dehydrogenase E1 component [Pseudobdellovibrionaceae bacterium]